MRYGTASTGSEGCEQSSKQTGNKVCTYTGRFKISKDLVKLKNQKINCLFLLFMRHIIRLNKIPLCKEIRFVILRHRREQKEIRYIQGYRIPHCPGD